MTVNPDIQLGYRDIDYGSPQDCALLARWYNDPAIKHLYTLFTSAEQSTPEFTPAHFEREGKRPPTGGPYRSLMVLAPPQQPRSAYRKLPRSRGDGESTSQISRR